MLFLLMIDEVHRDTRSTIYSKYKNDMLKVAYSVLKDSHEAQDVVQSSIIRVYSSLDRLRLDNEKETKGYILMITKNHAINVYNRRKKVSYLDIEQINTLDHLSIDDVENNLLNYELSKEIAAKLSMLNPRYSAVLTLKYLHDFTTKEISRTLDWTETNTRVTLHRAKNALKKILLEGENER